MDQNEWRKKTILELKENLLKEEKELKPIIKKTQIDPELKKILSEGIWKKQRDIT